MTRIRLDVAVFLAALAVDLLFVAWLLAKPGALTAILGG